MAEGLARAVLPAGYTVASAGAAPTQLNPGAVRAMAELGIDISSQHAKFQGDLRAEDYACVVRLCDCGDGLMQLFPDARHEAWPVPDPADAPRSAAAQAFRHVRDELLERLETFLPQLGPDPQLDAHVRAAILGLRRASEMALGDSGP